MVSEHQILNARILIVNDQKLDDLVLEKILKSAGYHQILFVSDSRQATAAYQHYHPDIILLDLNMPQRDGFAVMEELKNIEKESYLPILVLSGESAPEKRLRALQSGAKDFLSKPYEGVEVLTRIHNILEVRMLHNQIRDQNRILETKVLEHTKELRDTRLDIIHRLARTAEYRDNETGIHIMRMSRYCACLGAAAGMSDPQCELLLHASPLHDIGKIGIPDDILLKPGKLDTAEFEIMKTHTTLGAELLSGSSFALMKMAAIIALTHHEKWDGTGYPKGLRGVNIPLVGRIAGICDVFDALTSRRPYKEPWPVQKAVDHIQTDSGAHFDPRLVEYFLKVIPEIKNIRTYHNEELSI